LEEFENMGINESLKCPGLDHTLSTFPIEINCHQCGAIVEIWSDEIKRRCVQCKTMVLNPNPSVKIPEKQPIARYTDNLKSVIDGLLLLAVDLGCSAATIIDSEQIKIENSIAELCQETKCPNYASSPTCPPNVNGPDWLREYIKQIHHAILIELELPQELMYSEKRKEIAKLLHFIVIELEKTAHENGLSKSMAFAGGSCKTIHCSQYTNCNVLNGDGKCRYPDLSRPSVSGYGINMNHLLKKFGRLQKNDESSISTSSRYGLLLLG
jgi:predicted metal-binding protein